MTRYPLTPDLAAFVARSAAFPAADDSLPALRAAYRRMCAAFTPPRPAGVTTTDFTLSAGGLTVPARLYQPPGAPPAAGWPGVLYLHGGGWVVGDLDSHDFLTAALAARRFAAVVAIDYRLAPEHPFPAAFDDTLAAWRALQAGHAALGLDPRRLAVAGDSAGGNLAAALCLALHDGGGHPPCGQALVYPALAGMSGLPSYREHADAPLLTAADVDWYRAQYLPDPASCHDPRAAPLAAADVGRVPPAFIAVAEFDPLCDDGIEYARRLAAAGVAVDFYLGAGLVHGCLRAMGACPDVDRLIDALVRALGRFLQVDG